MGNAENYTKESLYNIKDLIDVSRVVGNPIVVEDSMILPITEIKLCFLSGGSDYPQDKKESLPFGGITGGNISVKPIGFLVIHKDEVKTLSLEEKGHSMDRILDMILELVDKIKEKKTNYSSSSDSSSSSMV